MGRMDPDCLAAYLIRQEVVAKTRRSASSGSLPRTEPKIVSQPTARACHPRTQGSPHIQDHPPRKRAGLSPISSSGQARPNHSSRAHRSAIVPRDRSSFSAVSSVPALAAIS